MKPILSTSSDMQPAPKADVELLQGRTYRAVVQLKPLVRDMEATERAALLVFRFLNADGDEIEPPDGLLRTREGGAYHYISYHPGRPCQVDFEAPVESVKAEISILPWQIKEYFGEVLAVKKHLDALDIEQDEAQPRKVLLDISDITGGVFDALTHDQLKLRLFIETLNADRTRTKHDFSQGTTLPAPDRLAVDPAYGVARDYLQNRRAKRKGGRRHLVVCNGYPSTTDRYVNAFVHARIKMYQAGGIDVDVVAYAKGFAPKIHGYDGVEALTGYVNELVFILAQETYTSVSVHFMHPHMWSVMRNFTDKHKFQVFVHGHEIRNWIRGFTVDDGLQGAFNGIARSVLLRDFWNYLLAQENFPDNYIFVSNWMKSAAQGDIMCKFPESRSNVIHNLVDSDFFQYREKTREDVRKILIVRNFDKGVYATDIALQCLKTLKEGPFWPELEISIFGKGARLKEFFTEFAQDQNVSINEGYLSPGQIRAAHAEHGIMLIPSRMDSQGVSRGEAMASGLVPATNDVCAIPEFTDSNCAILAPPEDYLALARGIEALIGNPEKFLAMSRAASQRVRAQCGYDNTIRREMGLMGFPV